MAEHEVVGRNPEWYEPAPYEGWGSLGSLSLDTLISLSEIAPTRTDGERRWFVGDHNALLGVAGLEDRLRLHGLPHGAPPDVRAQLNDYLDAWHGALPFNEAEREIVRSAYSACPERPLAYREVPSQLRKSEVSVMTSGVQRIVRGRELMGRWWAWRRELDNFEGQDGPAQAKAALIGLVGRLIAPDKLPYIYLDLRDDQMSEVLQRA